MRVVCGINPQSKALRPGISQRAYRLKLESKVARLTVGKDETQLGDVTKFEWRNIAHDLAAPHGDKVVELKSMLLPIAGDRFERRLVGDTPSVGRVQTQLVGVPVAHGAHPDLLGAGQPVGDLARTNRRKATIVRE